MRMFAILNSRSIVVISFHYYSQKKYRAMKTSALCILKGKEEQMLQEPVGTSWPFSETRSFFEGRFFVVRFVFVTDFSCNT